MVTDADWLRHALKFLGPLILGEVMVFDADELDDAKRWFEVGA